MKRQRNADINYIEVVIERGSDGKSFTVAFDSPALRAQPQSTDRVRVRAEDDADEAKRRIGHALLTLSERMFREKNAT